MYVFMWNNAECFVEIGGLYILSTGECKDRSCTLALDVFCTVCSSFEELKTEYQCHWMKGSNPRHTDVWVFGLQSS